MLEGALSLEYACGTTGTHECSASVWLTTVAGVRHRLELTPQLAASVGSLSNWSGEYVRAELDAPPTGLVHTVERLSIVPEVFHPPGFKRQATFGQSLFQAQFSDWPGRPHVGPRPYVVILVKFADQPQEPTPKSYFEALHSNTYPGLDHYYRNVSYNQMNLTGTTVINYVTLPKPMADYLIDGEVHPDKVIPDAVQLVDHLVDFRQFYGITIMPNVEGGRSRGGGMTLTLDGETRVFGTTLNNRYGGQPPSQTLLVHEMGHSLGLGHSGSDTDEYGSPFCPQGHGGNSGSQFHHVGNHYHMAYKAWMGWVPTSRQYFGFPGSNRTVRIYRRSDPGLSLGVLLARVYFGFGREYYTLEAVKGSVGGYDGAPQSGYVVVAKAKETVYQTWMTVVDTKAGGTATDPLRLGEQYSNPADGVRFKVVGSDANSFLVEIEVGAHVPWPHHVTHVGDSGKNSLREAIAFNHEFHSYYPQFMLPPAQLSGGVGTVNLFSPLPTITKNAFVLNGLTQRVFGGDTNPSGPEIVIDGSNAGDWANGVYLKSSNSIVRSIGIQNFKGNGVLIEGPIENNVVDQCHIGVSANGLTKQGNNGEGVSIRSGAKNTWIGGTTARGNVISGNQWRGVGVWDAGTDGTFINGNIIGSNRTVTASLTTTGEGILIGNGPKNTKIQNNTVSGNAYTGIYIWGSGSDSSSIQGNRVGVNGAGTGALPNGQSGIGVGAPEGASSSPKFTLIGGTLPAHRNVISGNVGSGIYVGHPTMTNVTISGNWIGVGTNGVASVPNQGSGISIGQGATIKIGGVTADERNVIANNGNTGIYASKATNLFIQGNWIGYNANRGNAGNQSSSIGLDNCVGPRVGGAGVDLRNYIGNAAGSAISLWNGTRNGFIQGNIIGLGTTGTGSGPISQTAITVSGGAHTNMIGGTTAGTANIIGNAQGGVGMWDAGTTNNRVYGNWIGFQTNGSSAPISGTGVSLSTSSSGNYVGGVPVAQRNVIGNCQNGIGVWTSTSNFIVGNWIGIGPSSQAAALSSSGVSLGNSANGNRITDNVIGHVPQDGISLWNSSSSNHVERNLIGFKPDGIGVATIGQRGVLINSGASNNTIGGVDARFGNRIGNAASAVGIFDASNNRVEGNTFGRNASGSPALFTGDVVTIWNASIGNWIGGTQAGQGNIITGGENGVAVGGASAASNRIRINSIFDNRRLGINLYGNDGAFGVTANDSLDSDSGPNGLSNFPSVSSVSVNGANVTVTGSLSAKPSTSYTVDIYVSEAADPSGYGEGQTYLGSLTVTTNASGFASFGTSFLNVSGSYVSATATDAAGNTSEFSVARLKG